MMILTNLTHFNVISTILLALQYNLIWGILLSLNLVFMFLAAKFFHKYSFKLIYNISLFFYNNSYFCLFILTYFTLFCYKLPLFLAQYYAFSIDKLKLFSALYDWLYLFSFSDLYALLLNSLLCVWIGFVILFICLRLLEISRYLKHDFFLSNKFFFILILLIFLGLIFIGLGLLYIYLILKCNNNNEFNQQNTLNSEGEGGGRGEITILIMIMKIEMNI